MLGGRVGGTGGAVEGPRMADGRWLRIGEADPRGGPRLSTPNPFLMLWCLTLVTQPEAIVFVKEPHRAGNGPRRKTGLASPGGGWAGVLLGRESGPSGLGWQRLFVLASLRPSDATVGLGSNSLLFGLKPLQKQILKHTQAEMSVTDAES